MLSLTDSQKWFILVLLVVGSILIYLLSPMLTPFLIAGLLGYLGDPLVDRLQTWKLSRTIAVLLVFISMFLMISLIVVLLVPVIESQFVKLIHALPGYVGWLNETLLPWLQARFGIEGPLLSQQELQNILGEHWQKAGSVAAYALNTLSKSGLLLLGWLANLVLIPVVTFYMLRDWDHFVAYIDDLLPRNLQSNVASFASEVDDVLSAFLRGQLMVMLGLAAIYASGLWIAGVEFALLIGLIAGLVSFVPYLGFIVGIVVAAAAVMFQSQDWIQLIYVVAVFGVGQLIEGTLLTPWLVGDRIGLHPVAVIFAVLAGGQLFGFFGVLLALPVAAVLSVIVRHMHRSYVASTLYQTDIV